LKNRMWWENQKYIFLLIFVVAVIALIIGLVVVRAFVCAGRGIGRGGGGHMGRAGASSLLSHADHANRKFSRPGRTSARSIIDRLAIKTKLPPRPFCTRGATPPSQNAAIEREPSW
jgi:hypothetical protein